MKARKMLPAVIFALVLVGCVPLRPAPPQPVLPDAQEARSPLAVPSARQRTYLPLALGAPNKLGLSGANCDQLGALGASWGYVWHSRADAGCRIVPMIWDETHVEDAVVSGQEWLLLFNECDHPGQCALPPAAAVAPLARVEARFPLLQLVAPVPAYGPAWLIETYDLFVARYGRAPRWQALAAHCYLNTAAACAARVGEFVALAERWDIPEVWVTEYFFDQEAEARRFVAWLEQEPRVTRHSPFVSRLNCEEEQQYWDCAAAGDPSLFTFDNRLTPRGQWYWRQPPEFP